MIYYFVPNTKVRLREVWLGAIFAGVLWRIAFIGFALYIRGYTRWSVHGSITAVVIFLVWVYVSAVILLYGVEVSAAYARLDMEERLAREQTPPKPT
jgi:membrane protein